MLFFFVKQKTAYEMRMSDWSSDVCSSDLLLVDPAVAEQAHAAGEGAVIEARLGGKSGVAGDAPLVGRFHVEKLGSGRFTGTGPFYGGSRMDLGPMALLRLDR